MNHQIPLGHRRELRKSDLPPNSRQLIEKLQRLNYGKIENLIVRGGEPVLGPETRITRDVKFGATNGFRPELNQPDFVLCSQLTEMFNSFRAIETGTVKSLEVQAGLPFRMQIEE